MLLLEQLLDFQSRLDGFAGLAGSVRKRLSRASRMARETLGAYEDAWDEAIFAIWDQPDYSGLELKPIEGLVPIGPDPDSGLWEFWHIESGDKPERDEALNLRLTDQMGMVMVLIPVPRGQTRIGSQKSDPGAPYYDELATSYDEPLREVKLDPYLLSKYELTQGQWQRLAGNNPSRFHPGASQAVAISLLHPVEAVSWARCRDVLFRFGCELPTSARWEHAARAGTTTPWWSGTEKEQLQRAANVADQHYRRNLGNRRGYEEWNDGHTIHAPVGSYSANGFGLHDVMGNVGELCADKFEIEREGHRAFRGGSYSEPAADARSAYRFHTTQDNSADDLGVRPAMSIDSWRERASLRLR